MEVRRQSTLLPGGGSSSAEAAGSGLPVSSVSFNSAAAMSSFACLAQNALKLGQVFTGSCPGRVVERNTRTS